MGRVQWKKVQRLGSTPQRLLCVERKIRKRKKNIRRKNKRENKRFSNISSPGFSCVNKTPVETPNHNVNMSREQKRTVQYTKSAPQQCIDINLEKESTCLRICRQIQSKSIYPESTHIAETLQETLNQITNNDIITISDSSDDENKDSRVFSPSKIPIITTNNDVIIISDSSDDQDENSCVNSPSKAVVSVIIKIDDAISTNIITIEKHEQNTSLPVPEDSHLLSSKAIVSIIENNDTVGCSSQTVPPKIVAPEIKTTVSKYNNFQSILPLKVTSCDGDVQFVSSSSNNYVNVSSSSKQYKIETIITLDASNEEKRLHQQPIKQPINSEFIKERRVLPVSSVNIKKRKYNGPLHNCKRIKKIESNFEPLKGDLREFLLVKQRLKEHELLSNAITSQEYKPSTELKPKLRPIIIDGLNIGYLHGGQKTLSIKGIYLCIKYFIDRGHEEVIAFLPQHRQRPRGYESKILLNELIKMGHICLTPSRKIKNKRITCDDDRMILNYAHEHGGVVVSNDNYRDMYEENDTFKDIIDYRQVMVTFVNDQMIVPEDQYNRHLAIRTLSDILRFPPWMH